MDKNTLLVITVIVSLLSFSSGSTTEKKEKAEQADTEELVDYYQKSSLKNYDNLQDFYIVMRHLDYPNLKDSEDGYGISNLDFENPQSLKKYKEIIDRLESESTNRNLKAEKKWAKKTEKERVEDEKRYKAKFNQVEKFKKDLFFKHIKSKLSLEPNSTQQVCFNIDRVSLGFLDNSSVFISRREREKIIAEKISYLVYSLPLSTQAIESLKIDYPLVSCDALITVNSNELTHLNSSPEISSILTPEMSPSNTFTPL